jgi:hypothetical protein
MMVCLNRNHTYPFVPYNLVEMQHGFGYISNRGFLCLQITSTLSCKVIGNLEQLEQSCGGVYYNIYSRNLFLNKMVKALSYVFPCSRSKLILGVRDLGSLSSWL